MLNANSLVQDWNFDFHFLLPYVLLGDSHNGTVNIPEFIFNFELWILIVKINVKQKYDCISFLSFALVKVYFCKWIFVCLF